MNLETSKDGSRIHFVGIGGVSMSGLAEFLSGKGHIITGSDRETSERTEHLNQMGILTQVGHSSEIAANVDQIVYSAAIDDQNPEIISAQRQGIPLVKRAELLGQLTAAHQTIAVAGTHGKTTTTAMVAAVLEAAELDPTVMVGGIVCGTESNLRVGSGPNWVVEADEFDRSFLKLSPTIAVVTNLEADHLDSYGDLATLTESFDQFVRSVPESGGAVLCGDSPEVRELAIGSKFDRLYYGLEPGARLQADRLTQEGFGSHFRVLDMEKELGEINLRVPGSHNVCNALAAVGVGIQLELSWNTIKSGLEAFRGVRRRFEIVGEAAGVTVVNDYAHHPTEIRATLAAARKGWENRIVAVFQPHLFSRTRDFAPDFGKALSAADRVWVTDIYPAREDPIPGITGNLVAEMVENAGGPKPVYHPILDSLVDKLKSEVSSGDLVVVMGAGDIEQVAFGLYESLQEE